MSVSGAEVPSRLALDTSAYSRMRAGEEAVIETMAAAELVMVPTIVVGELEAGFRSGSRAPENLARLAEFLAEPFVLVLPITRDVAARYGQMFAELRRAGTPVPVNDIWIAAATVDSGAHLVTFDRDFERFAALSVTVLG